MQSLRGSAFHAKARGPKGSRARCSTCWPLADQEAIRWEELGLRPGIDLGFFTLRYYSLAYLAGIVLAYWQCRR